MIPARTIQLVVLDWAGTTVDFGCFAPVASFAKALRRHGVSPTDEQVRRPMGTAKKDHLRALLAIPELAKQWNARHGRAWDESDVGRIYLDDYVPLQLEAVAGHDRLVPGLLPVVEALRGRSVKIATTTGYFREAARLVFDSATRQGYARDLDVLPDEVPAGRPAPWMIFRAMQALDIYPPSSVVKVGDTPSDIAEGVNAGAWSVGVIASGSEVGLSEVGWASLSDRDRKGIVATVRSTFERAGAHAVIETLAELPALIADLERRPEGADPMSPTDLTEDLEPFPGEADPRLAHRKALTLGLLVLGYTGFYACRSNFAVSLSSIIADLAKTGIDPKTARLSLGSVTTLGTLAYALGKLPGGGLVDFLGGRRIYLSGMAGAVLFTVVFALGGSIPVFTLAWVGNRMVQAIGWPGMVKIISRWFPSSTYGMAMGIVSLSYLWGDSAGRYGMGLLIKRGVDWRGVYFIAAGLLSVFFALNLALLRESPGELGLMEPRTNPGNLFGAGGSDPTPPGLRELLLPLFRSPVFWLVCGLSFGLTLVRETFNTWTVLYFEEAVGMEKDRAAGMSALFPLFGGFSVLLAGYLGDRARRGGRAAIIAGGMSLTGGSLMALGLIDPRASDFWPVLLVSLTAFLLIGPYSYLAGAISLDLGGKRGGATTCGIVDFIGYLGGAFAGRAMAGISADHGWRGAFLVLAVVAWLSALGAGWLMIAQARACGSAKSKN